MNTHDTALVTYDPETDLYDLTVARSSAAEYAARRRSWRRAEGAVWTWSWVMGLLFAAVFVTAFVTVIIVPWVRGQLPDPPSTLSWLILAGIVVTAAGCAGARSLAVRRSVAVRKEVEELGLASTWFASSRRGLSKQVLFAASELITSEVRDAMIHVEKQGTPGACQTTLNAIVDEASRRREKAEREHIRQQAAKWDKQNAEAKVLADEVLGILPEG